jgi:hypothetical protein
LDTYAQTLLKHAVLGHSDSIGLVEALPYYNYAVFSGTGLKIMYRLVLLSSVLFIRVFIRAFTRHRSYDTFSQGEKICKPYRILHALPLGEN